MLLDLARAASLGHRVDLFDGLTRAAERLQRMERIAHGIDDANPPSPDESFEALLRKAELREAARRAETVSHGGRGESSAGMPVRHSSHRASEVSVAESRSLCPVRLPIG